MMICVQHVNGLKLETKSEDAAAAEMCKAVDHPSSNRQITMIASRLLNAEYTPGQDSHSDKCGKTMSCHPANRA